MRGNLASISSIFPIKSLRLVVPSVVGPKEDNLILGAAEVEEVGAEVEVKGVTGV